MKPFFRDDQCHATPRRRRLSEAAEAAWPDRTVPPGDLFAEGGCESGNLSGTEADLEPSRALGRLRVALAPSALLRPRVLEQQVHRGPRVQYTAHDLVRVRFRVSQS